MPEEKYHHTHRTGWLRAAVLGANDGLVSTAVATRMSLIPFVAGISIGFLAILGALAARVGGASMSKGAVRVLFWGALAMGLTAAVGALFGPTL
jgi:VIT1/CCC1 family predicted Fe2+/Mn2+ transporter